MPFRIISESESLLLPPRKILTKVGEATSCYQAVYLYIYTRENQIAVIDEASKIKREINSSIQKNPSFRRKRKEKELLFSSPRKRKKEKGLRKEKEKIGRFAQYSTIALRPHR